MEIAGASVAFIVHVAPKAPEAIAREAAVRLAGWTLDNRSRPSISHEIRRPKRYDHQIAIRKHGGDRKRL